MNQKFKLDVNGKTHTVDVDPDMPLLYALRGRSRIEQPAFRLRPRPMRRLHGPSRRPADPLLQSRRFPRSATARW